MEQHICPELFGHVETQQSAETTDRSAVCKFLFEGLHDSYNLCLMEIYHQQIFHLSYVWKEQSGSHLKLLHRCDSEMSQRNSGWWYIDYSRERVSDFSLVPKTGDKLSPRKQSWDYMIPGILKLTLQSLMNDISEVWTANMAK